MLVVISLLEVRLSTDSARSGGDCPYIYDMVMSTSLRLQGTRSGVSGVFGTADASDARMRQLLLRAEVETDSPHKACHPCRIALRAATLDNDFACRHCLEGHCAECYCVFGRGGSMQAWGCMTSSSYSTVLGEDVGDLIRQPEAASEHWVTP